MLGPLSNQIPETGIEIDYYMRPVSSEFQFENITLDGVKKEIRNLDEAKFSGIDKISAKCLKGSCTVSAPILTHMFNCSLLMFMKNLSHLLTSY